MVQVTPGHERAAVRRITRVAGDAIQECFAVRQQMPYREAGRWTLREQVMFPGYVFAVVRDVDLFRERMELAGPYNRLLEGAQLQSGRQVRTLEPQEAAFIAQFGGAEHVVGMSCGDIVNGTVVVREGPLKGRTALIEKIDRHHRMAQLRVGMLGRRGVRVGLEVVTKT